MWIIKWEIFFFKIWNLCVLLKKNYYEYFCENIIIVNNDKLLIINFFFINKSYYLKYGIYVFNWKKIVINVLLKNF